MIVLSQYVLSVLYVEQIGKNKSLCVHLCLYKLYFYFARTYTYKHTNAHTNKLHRKERNR